MKAVVLGGEAWKRILSRMAKERAFLEVGVLEGATNSVTGEPVAPYAFFNEYGTDTIPPRPAFHSALSKHEQAWVNSMAQYLKSRYTESGIVVKGLRVLGAVMRDDIRAQIASNMPPPNSPLTKARKAEDAGTLIWTGSYLKSIDYNVEKG